MFSLSFFAKQFTENIETALMSSVVNTICCLAGAYSRVRFDISMTAESRWKHLV